MTPGGHRRPHLQTRRRQAPARHYGEAGPREARLGLTVQFELDGQQFTALNGGPEFSFDEAIPFQVDCAHQADVDAG